MLDIDDKVITDISRGFSVPAQPKLLLELQDLMAESEPDLNAIADAISQDVSVSATILKTINSPLYGLSRTMSDIHKSVRYIGINGIVSLVTNTLIRKSIDQSDCSIALEEFWDNAIQIAQTCVHIGKSLKQAVSKDKLFSLGLFHDCGIPVMAMKYGQYNETYLHAFNTPSKPLTVVEDEVFGVNHATLGYYVATSWRLPKDICQLILQHHDRMYLESREPRIQQFYYAILKIAENIVHNHKHFKDATDWPYVQEQVFTILNIDEEDYQDYFEDTAELYVIG